MYECEYNQFVAYKMVESLLACSYYLHTSTERQTKVYKIGPFEATLNKREW